MTKTFLQAEWRKLAIVNYSVDKKILGKYLPNNTEIDLWSDTCFVSLVGFMFINTRLKGYKIPFHTNFEEVNLRFYVRYNEGGKWKRGVVFIKEIVPRSLLTLVANNIYQENYETMPMSHSWTNSADSLIVEYRWKKKQLNLLKVIADKNANLVKPDSEEEFITEHYWGYTRISNEKSAEYGVEHPKWEIYQTKDYLVDVDFCDIYGQEFNFLKSEKPKSVFLAEGSEIKVKGSRHI